MPGVRVEGAVTDRTAVGRILEVDQASFARAFWQRPIAVRHSLAGHPLFSLEALARLADSLPLRAIERHVGEQPLLVPGGAPELEGPPSETVLGIEGNGYWMVLWNIEQDPRYKAVRDAVLDAAEAYLPRDRDASMRRREAFLFLSAPNSITPVHFDPEHNFLLQIRGLKTINVGCFPDPADQQRELDRYYDGGHRNLERIPSESEAFHMSPGDGVYVWPFAPHWVENGPEASISLSITWRTTRSQREERVHTMNAKLRARGRSPAPPGASPAIDRVKGGVVGAVQGLRRLRQRGPHISR
jgi:hypothetical protein